MRRLALLICLLPLACAPHGQDAETAALRAAPYPELIPLDQLSEDEPALDQDEEARLLTRSRLLKARAARLQRQTPGQ